MHTKDLYVGLAKAYQRKNMWHEAVTAWQRSLLADPDVSEWQLGLGVAARRSGDLNKSADALKKSIDLCQDEDAPSTTRAVRLLTRVLRTIVANEATTSTTSSSSLTGNDSSTNGSQMVSASTGKQMDPAVDKGARVSELRLMISTLITRLEKKLETASNGSISSKNSGKNVLDAVMDVSEEDSNDLSSGATSSSMTSTSSAGLTSKDRIMSEVGALYVLLGRLYLTPAMKSNQGGRYMSDADAQASISPQEEAMGLTAFRKGAAYAKHAAAHQPAAAAALAPLYEAVSNRVMSPNKLYLGDGSSSNEGDSKGEETTHGLSPTDAKLIAASLYRRALCGVLTAYGGLTKDDSLPIGSFDVAKLVSGLGRVSMNPKINASPAAANLLSRTLFVSPQNPYWNINNQLSSDDTSSSMQMSNESSLASSLHDIMSKYLKSNRLISRNGSLVVRLTHALSHPRDPASWLGLGNTVCGVLEIRYSDLVDPSTNLQGWAQDGGFSSNTNNTSLVVASTAGQSFNSEGGKSVSVGTETARCLLLLGLNCFRHATTLGLAAEEESHAWLWAGALAECLGDNNSAKAHFNRSMQADSEEPASAVRLAKVLSESTNSRNNSADGSNKAMTAEEEAVVAAEAVEVGRIAEDRVRRAVALDPDAGTSAAESSLASSMSLLRSGDAEQAIAGFLEVAYRKANAPVKDSNDELLNTAVMGLIDGVITTVHATINASSNMIGLGGAVNTKDNSDNDGLSISGGFTSNMLDAIESAEAQAPLRALEKALSLVGDTQARKSAVSRLCDAVGNLATEAIKKSNTSKSQSGNKQAYTLNNIDVAAPIAVFNVVMRALPNVSACLPAIHRLCVLGRELSLKANRDVDAVAVVNIALGFLSTSAPDQQGVLSAQKEDSITHMLSGSLKPALKCHASGWALGLKVLSSIGDNAALNNEETNALQCYTLALNYDPSHVCSLDGIVALGRAWSYRDDVSNLGAKGVFAAENSIDMSSTPAVDLVQGEGRAVNALRVVLGYEHGHSGAWSALAAEARKLQRTREATTSDDEGGDKDVALFFVFCISLSLSLLSVSSLSHTFPSIPHHSYFSFSLFLYTNCSNKLI